MCVYFLYCVIHFSITQVGPICLFDVMNELCEYCVVRKFLLHEDNFDFLKKFVTIFTLYAEKKNRYFSFVVV